MFVVSNGKLSTDRTLSNMRNNINNQFNTHLYSAANIPFSQMSNGILCAKCDEYINDVQESYKIKSLDEVLNNTVIEKISALNNPQLSDILLSDINNYPGLIPVFNNTPQTIDFYCQLINTNLRTDPTELLYWTTQADIYRPELPKKAKLIDPKDLNFDTDSNGNIIIKHGKNELAVYSPMDDLYNVSSLEFLNFLARPDHNYRFENINFSTDELGRISSVTFSSDKKLNKTDQKNPVKYNDIAKALTGNNKNNLYSTLLKKYNVPAIASYAVTVNSDNDLKQGLKAFNKAYKNDLKSGMVHAITIRQTYNDGTDVPSGIEICPNGESHGFKLH